MDSRSALLAIGCPAAPWIVGEPSFGLFFSSSVVCAWLNASRASHLRRYAEFELDLPFALWIIVLYLPMNLLFPLTRVLALLILLTVANRHHFFDVLVGVLLAILIINRPNVRTFRVWIAGDAI